VKVKRRKESSVTIAAEDMSKNEWLGLDQAEKS